MTKAELRTGMFGIDNEGGIFVVVGDKLMYENGMYDNVADMNDNLEFVNHHIIELHEATCFKMVKEGRSSVIWERPECDCEECDCEEDAITITEDEFFEAVKAANELFFAIGNKKKPVRPEVEMMMGLQNIAFGELVGQFLFGKEAN